MKVVSELTSCVTFTWGYKNGNVQSILFLNAFDPNLLNVKLSLSN